MISKKGEINKFKDASMFLNCGIDVFCGQLLESEICFVNVLCAFVHDFGENGSSLKNNG